MRALLQLVCAAFVLSLPALVAGGEEQPASPLQAPWKLDRVVLRSGQVLEGLIEGENDRALHFLEIRRPAGRRMYGVFRPLEREQIVRTERLEPDDRQAARQRFELFRNRAEVEAGKIEDVHLDAATHGSTRINRYAGRWFTLESTADDPTTRRCVVRIEQLFAAFAEILPPRNRVRQPLKILLLDSVAEYRSYLERLGLNADNAAFFSPEKNLVVAGSDLSRFAEKLAQVQQQHDALRRQIEQLQAELPERLKQRKAQLDRAGGSPGSNRRALVAFKRQFEDDLASRQRTLDSYDRKNEAVFREVTENMFARLHHEAFHAYLENYVYPHTRYDVPRWLNEGLAQVFEAGILEADTLRIDGPNQEALASLRAILQSPAALPLDRILSADYRSFLVRHGDSQASALHYVYSWGLAHYLTFERPLLGSPALEEYLQPAAAGGPRSPVPRFERLVGQSLSDFESQWRRYILALNPAAMR